MQQQQQHTVGLLSSAMQLWVIPSQPPPLRRKTQEMQKKTYLCHHKFRRVISSHMDYTMACVCVCLVLETLQRLTMINIALVRFDAMPVLPAYIAVGRSVEPKYLSITQQCQHYSYWTYCSLLCSLSHSIKSMYCHSVRNLPPIRPPANRCIAHADGIAYAYTRSKCNCHRWN